MTSVEYTWGGAADIPVPGDYDGDGKSDIACSGLRPDSGSSSTSGTMTGIEYTWGGVDDIPIPADYDGDSKTDIGVFRPSTGKWHIWRSGTMTGIETRGAAARTSRCRRLRRRRQGGHRRLPAVDRAVVHLNSGTVSSSEYDVGRLGRHAGAGDYDGDGKTDIAVFRPRPAQWFIFNSGTLTGIEYTWGGGVTSRCRRLRRRRQDRHCRLPALHRQVVHLAVGHDDRHRVHVGRRRGHPGAGDYDGDGKTDIAVFRPSTGQWFIINSGT